MTHYHYAPIMVSGPREPSDPQRMRAWTYISELRRYTEVVLCFDGQWTPDPAIAGILVCNSAGDIDTIRRAESLGIPVIYAPEIGRCEKGYIDDYQLSTPMGRMLLQMKVQTAHAVLVNSRQQARTLQAMCNTTVPVIIHPGGPSHAYTPVGAETTRSTGRSRPPTLWTIEPNVDSYADRIWAWATSEGYRTERTTPDVAIRQAAPGDKIFDPWPAPDPDRILSYGVGSVPFWAIDTGVIDCPCGHATLVQEDADPAEYLGQSAVQGPPPPAWRDWVESIYRAFRSIKREQYRL